MLKSTLNPLWSNLKRLSVLPLLFLLLSTGQEAKASHLMGVDMSYECIDPCTIRVHLYAYRDCSGSDFITPPGSPWQLVTPTPPGCGGLLPSPITAWSTQVTTAVTPVCPGWATCCDYPSFGCPAGILKGVEEFYWFRDYYICGPGMSGCQFVFRFSTCCRNGDITSLTSPSGHSLTTQTTTLNTAITPCNGSPVFTNPPVPYLCSNQPFTFNQGATDPEGDSLVYRLGPCYDSTPPDSVTYGAGYSSTAPLGPSYTVNINPATGDITITPTPGGVPETGVMCVYVEEWRGGVQINEIVRDMQITVIDCPSNTLPTSGGVTGMVGGVIDAPWEVTVCAGTDLEFLIPGVDPDAGDIVTMYWSGSLAAAGATFTHPTTLSITDTITGTTGSPPTGMFRWTPASTGTYTFLVTVVDDACPILGLNQYTVTINVIGGLPGSSATATLLGTCLDVSFVGDPGPGGTGPFTYQWDGNGNVNINPANVNPSFSHTYPGPGTYWYTLFITDFYGCIAEIAGSITIPTGPTADAGPNITMCSGYPVVLGTPALPGQTYQWIPPTGLSSTTIAQPTFNHIAPGPGPDTIDFTVTATVGPCDAVDFVTVIVHPIPTANIVGPTIICQGDSATLNASGGTNFLWSTGDTSASIKVGPTVTTTYTVSVISDGCASLPASHTVVVSNGPAAIISGQDSICPGDDVVLTAVGGDTWLWSTGATTQTITLSNVNRDTTVSVLPSIGLCPGPVVSFTVYQHEKPVADFIHTAVCFEEQTPFSDQTLYTYGNIIDWKWNFGDPASGTNNTGTDQNPVHAFSSPGVFNVQLIVTGSNGCMDTVTRSVTVHPLPQPDFEFTDVCMNETMFFNDNSISAAGIRDWFWTFDDGGTSTLQDPSHTYAAPGAYNVTLTVVDNNDCENTTTRTVFVHPLPDPSFTYQHFCFNSITEFTSTSTLNDPFGTTIALHEWDFGDPASGAMNTSTDVHPTHGYASPGTYMVTLTVTSSRGCQTTIVEPVVVTEVQPLTVGPDSVCPGYSATVKAGNAFPGSVIEWFGSETVPNPFHQGNAYYTPPLTSSVIYWVGMRDAQGCRSKRWPVLAYMYPPFPVIIEPSARTVQIPNAVVEFGLNFPHGGGPGSVDWHWDFGDGTTSTEAAPVHEFQAEGEYLVVLTTTDQWGCEVEREVLIIVEQDIRLIIPNAFTPNDDGTNDFFNVTTSLIKDFNIQIFDRWGGMQYQSEDVSFQWDGRDIKGQPLPEGVYPFVIKAVAYDNTEITRSGTVTILR